MFKLSLFKKHHMYALSALLLTAMFVLTVIVMTGSSAYADTTGQQAPKRVMYVTGQGTVQAEPDIAFITMGVVTEDKNAQIAQQQNAKAMNEVIAAIKSKGVADKDIKTSNYNISPRYSYDKDTGEGKITGYSVSNTVTVTIRDLKQTGAIIDAASQNGVNQSYNITFGLSDYEKYYNEALKAAVENAKKHAQTIADTLNVKLTAPTSVSESGYSPRYSYSYYGSVAADAAMAASTPVSSGNLDITANVSMNYEY